MRDAVFSMNRRNSDVSILEDYGDEDESSFYTAKKLVNSKAYATADNKN